MVKRFNATMADVHNVVESNNKKRFELIENPEVKGLWLIRAVQGHSISAVKDEELLEPLVLDYHPATSVHAFH